MKIIVCEVGGFVEQCTYTNPDEIVDFYHVDVTSTQLPSEPIESWIIEDGEIKIDQQKLIEFNRSRMPPLTRRQFKLTLLENNLLEAIESKIDQIEDPKQKSRIQIEYTEADKFERTSESVIYMINMLELTAEQVDQMWLHAMSL